uniref:Uncharacterized protein n=1 Tax=Sphaerodactylus townsendi TaxID=933632 RepID=A0ACB8FBM8_9SAUR
MQKLGAENVVTHSRDNHRVLSPNEEKNLGNLKAGIVPHHQIYVNRAELIPEPCCRGSGFLINSKPENACEAITPPPLKDNSSRTFIVLIRRLDCNFDIKVLNAQRAGYKAAIVHNVDSDELISMGSKDIDVLKKIDIPSVFIGESSANSLKEEFSYETGGHIVLIPEFNLPLEYYLIPFLIIVGICLILIVIFMVGLTPSIWCVDMVA